jgi:hypothetical protein
VQQPQQSVAEPAQPQRSSVQREPFPWKRTIVFCVFALALGLLTVLTLLATGHVIDYIWFYIAPAFAAFIVSIVPILHWLFPANPVGQSIDASVQEQPQIASSPVTLNQTNTIPAPQTSTNSAIPPDQIFYVAQSLPAPDEFYGRESERIDLINRISKGGSTALVGAHLAGKSWLIQYVQQKVQTHPQLGPQVHIGEINAAHPLCHTRADFVKEALDALHLPPHRLNPHDPPLAYLSLKVREMKLQGITPVLCIYEFTGLIGKPDFDRRFLDELRAIAQHDKLVLIIVSRKPLHKLIEQITGETSPLLNIMPELTLQPFTEAEAKAFINKKGQRGTLSGDEQAFFQECAAISQANGKLGWPPLSLQLAGQLLLKDKFSGVLAPSDSAYQADFKQRLAEQYQGMVKL